MLLTFHTDFSNEENGNIMFYKGFLAYYQAVGEWSLLPALPSGLSHRSGQGNKLQPKEAGSLAFLVFLLKMESGNLASAAVDQFPENFRETWGPEWTLSPGFRYMPL